MVRSCHRCSADLPGIAGESTFCPHCGAPQLRVLEENVSPAAAVAGVDPATSTGALPPPHPGRIVWSTVLASAAAVAGIAAALMIVVFWLPILFPLAWLWTVGGAIVVLSLYARRHPETRMSARIGARVGLVYGLLAVAALALVAAASALVARFGLHTMGALDAWLTNAMHQAVLQQQAQASSSVPAVTPDQLRVFFSPEVRAGLALFLLTVAAVFLTLFSTLGGAVGGLLRVRRR